MNKIKRSNISSDKRNNDFSPARDGGPVGPFVQKNRSMKADDKERFSKELRNRSVENSRTQNGGYRRDNQRDGRREMHVDSSVRQYVSPQGLVAWIKRCDSFEELKELCDNYKMKFNNIHIVLCFSRCIDLLKKKKYKNQNEIKEWLTSWGELASSNIISLENETLCTLAFAGMKLFNHAESSGDKFVKEPAIMVLNQVFEEITNCKQYDWWERDMRGFDASALAILANAAVKYV